jgi:hypothetical protein
MLPEAPKMSEFAHSWTTRRLGLPAARSFGAGYLVFQAYWLIAHRPPSPEWSVLQVAVLLGGSGALITGGTAAHYRSPSLMSQRFLCVVAAVAGSGIGLALALLLWFVFAGPVALLWAGMGWAAIGSLLVRPRWSKQLAWVCCLAVACVGLTLMLVVLRRLPWAVFDYEDYALAHASVVPMLLAATLACYRVPLPPRGQARS